MVMILLRPQKILVINLTTYTWKIGNVAEATNCIKGRLMILEQEFDLPCEETFDEAMTSVLRFGC